MKALGILVLLALAARAEAKGCHETSHVVGYEHCTWFGTWSRDTPVFPLWVELTYYRHTFDGDLATTSNGPMFRILAGRLLYAGLEGGGGWISDPPRAYRAMQPGVDGYLSGHVVGGAHVVLWRLGLGEELAAGGRWAMLQTSRELELRARADIFMTPQWSIGVVVGKSLIDSDDRELLITTGVHVRALDGAP